MLDERKAMHVCDESICPLWNAYASILMLITCWSNILHMSLLDSNALPHALQVDLKKKWVLKPPHFVTNFHNIQSKVTLPIFHPQVVNKSMQWCHRLSHCWNWLVICGIKCKVAPLWSFHSSGVRRMHENALRRATTLASTMANWKSIQLTRWYKKWSIKGEQHLHLITDPHWI